MPLLSQKTEILKEPSLSCFYLLGCMFQYNLVSRAFPLRKWEGREKALASAGRFFFVLLAGCNVTISLIFMRTL